MDRGVSKSELAGCTSTSASSVAQQNLGCSVGSVGAVGRFGNSRCLSCQFGRFSGANRHGSRSEQLSG